MTKREKLQMKLSIFISLTVLMNLLVSIVFFKFIYDENKCKFLGSFSFLTIATYLIGFLLTYQNNRNIRSSFAIVFFPFGIYNFFSYPETGTTTISILSMIAIILTAIDIYIKNIPINKNKKHIFIIRTKKLVKRVYIILGLASMFLFLIVLLHCSVFSEQNKKLACNTNHNNIISFSLEDWESADSIKKEEYAQSIVNLECERLSIFPSLKLVVKSKMSNIDLGYYSDSNKQIVINKKHLLCDNLQSVLNTLSHEARHSFQHQYILNIENYKGKGNIEKTVTNTCASFKSSFANYISYDSKKDKSVYFKYYWQAPEIDSRQYAESESHFLMSVILQNQ